MMGQGLRTGRGSIGGVHLMSLATMRMENELDVLVMMGAQRSPRRSWLVGWLLPPNN